MNKPELSIWSCFLLGLKPEEQIDEFQKAGFCCTELSDEDGAYLLEQGDEAVQSLRRYAEQQGFRYPQGHLWLRANICAQDDTVEKLKRWLELFLQLGVRSAVLHAGNDAAISDEERMARRVKALRALTDHVHGTELCICMENLARTPGANNAAQLNQLIDAVGSDQLGICLDTGHLNISSEKTSQREFILTAGKRLKALHIADNEGQTDQHMMPFGRGNVNWEEVAAALREIGYDRLFNLEIPGESYGCPLEVRKLKMRYVRAMYDEWFAKRVEG